MSPAAELLEKHIDDLELSQAAFARLTGMPASYVSGLVSGKLHVPRHSKFLEQVAAGLALPETQISEMQTAIKLSPRSLTLSPCADREVFLLIATLRDRMLDLDGELAHLIRTQINVCCVLSGLNQSFEGR